MQKVLKYFIFLMLVPLFLKADFVVNGVLKTNNFFNKFNKNFSFHPKAPLR